MPFPIKTCVLCGEEFELKPDKPGYANRCPACSTPEAEQEAQKAPASFTSFTSSREANAARREAMRNLLYRKDS